MISIQRRELLRGAGWIAVSAVGGALSQGCATEPESEVSLGQAQSALDGLTEEEIQITERLAEVMIPTDETPGARETASAAFALQNMGSRGPAAVEGIKQACAAINAIAVDTQGDEFLKLPDAAAEAVMLTVASTAALAPFWQGFRTLTVSHYYAHPIGTAAIGMPGPTIDTGGFPGGRRPDGLDTCPVI